MGIRGVAHDLLRSYLENRLQKVRVGKAASEYKIISMGVPQGTILGPLLYILYINDLLTNMPKDTVISTARSWNEAKDNLIGYLQKISVWLALNKQSLNVDRTVFLTIGDYCDSVLTHMEIEINGMRINRVEHRKYLGITIDYNLNWINI